jgi:hypothetical protein
MRISLCFFTVLFGNLWGTRRHLRCNFIVLPFIQIKLTCDQRCRFMGEMVLAIPSVIKGRVDRSHVVVKPRGKRTPVVSRAQPSESFLA